MLAEVYIRIRARVQRRTRDKIRVSHKSRAREHTTPSLPFTTTRTVCTQHPRQPLTVVHVSHPKRVVGLRCEIQLTASDGHVPDNAPHALVALGTVTLVCSEMRVDKAKRCLGRVDGGVGGGVRGGVGGGEWD